MHRERVASAGLPHVVWCATTVNLAYTEHCTVALSSQTLIVAWTSDSDLDNMKGSTVDAMSDAVDNAEVMLSCISLAYKESASEDPHQSMLCGSSASAVDVWECRVCRLSP